MLESETLEIYDSYYIFIFEGFPNQLIFFYSSEIFLIIVHLITSHLILVSFICVRVLKGRIQVISKCNQQTNLLSFESLPEGPCFIVLYSISLSHLDIQIDQSSSLMLTEEDMIRARDNTGIYKKLQQSTVQDTKKYTNIINLKGLESSEFERRNLMDVYLNQYEEKLSLSTFRELSVQQSNNPVAQVRFQIQEQLNSSLTKSMLIIIFNVNVNLHSIQLVSQY